ncbi:hypothetical protein [Flavobacterium sp. LB1P71]|uniref:hypothetical protein n=1 Tax=Flavobacterium sp. LB1P71 TaxID=3401716 RepID=UPI003AACEA42
MNIEKLEPLKSKILFKRRDENNIDCGDILEIYNRQSFNDLNIQKTAANSSQFIEINDKFVFNSIKYKVVDINFKLLQDMLVLNERDSHLLTKDDCMSYNSQINIFVQELS